MKVEFVLVTQRRRLTLAGQLLVAQMAILLAVLVVVAFVSLAQSEATFTRTEGRRLFAIAEQLASTPIVRAEMQPGAVVNVLPTVVQSTVTQYAVTTVTLADTSGVARVSSDPTMDRTRIELGAASVAAGASWTGVLDVRGERMLVAQTPILNSEPQLGAVGEHLGTVVVSQQMPSILDRLAGSSSYLPTYLGLALAIGGLGSWLLARRLKRQTLGLEPAEITGLAESREAMLFGLAEGVVALDTNNRVTLVNNVAQRLLDLPEHAVGMSLDDLSLGQRLRDVLTGAHEIPGDEEEAESDGQPRGIRADGEPPRDQVVLRRGRVLVMNRMEVVKDGRPLGSVTTLRDRTELAALEREIGSFRSTTGLLRAQAHEFANQLHTISGLIQLGEYDEVVAFVDSLNERRAQLDLTLSTRLKDTTIAALVMAKDAEATERRVELRISENASLGRLTPRDSADVATVVGNLVDNAIDAAASGDASDAGERWVELGISQDANTVEVTVTDSGPGVAPELVTEVFTHGFTTKAAQAGERGIGLALTRMVCQRRGGEVEVEDTPNGARFSARLTVEPVTEEAR